MPTDSPILDPAALVVWNPLFQPDTVLAHVQHWRASGVGEARCTWWGRIYDGKPGGTPRRELLDSLDQALEACRRSLSERGRVVLFATDFRQLHVLEVDEVRRTLHEPELAPLAHERPAYYDTKTVIAWFRVRDVRALSFEALDTLQYLREHVRVKHSQLGYDPYASLGLRYPTFVCGPSVRELFDNPRAARGIPRFADLSETIYPPRLAQARNELESMLGASTWSGLEEGSRLFLASARILVTQLHVLDTQLELTPVVMYLSNALEREILGGVVNPMANALRSKEAFPSRSVLEQAWSMLRPDSKLSLGSSVLLVPALRTWTQSLPAAPALRALTANDAWRVWLDDFVERRNDAAHARHVDPLWATSAAAVMFGESAHPALDCPLRTVVAAKRELKALLGQSAT